MELKHQVCSLEIAKRLKELGVKQESEFHWQHHRSVNSPSGWAWSLSNTTNGHSVSAFTVAELGEILPRSVSMSVERATEHWFARCGFTKSPTETFSSADLDANLVNALAKVIFEIIQAYPELLNV